MVGDISEKTVRESIIAAIATLPEQSAEWNVARPYPEPEASVSRTMSGSGEQAVTGVLRYSLPKVELAGTTTTTFNLVQAWLNNALFEDIREEKGYVYAIGASIDGAFASQETYTLIVELSTDPSQIESVLSAVKSRLASLTDSPATPDQIAQWHKTDRDDFQQGINGAERQAEAMAYAPLFGRDPIESLTFDPAPPASPEEQTRVATQLTSPDATVVELIWMP